MPLTDSVRQRVLILGAGLVAFPAVEYLSRNSEWHVIVISAVEGEVQGLLVKLGRDNVHGFTRDVMGEGLEFVKSQITASHVVLSLLPAAMHVAIAIECIANRVPLCTASYVSPDMAALSDAAKNAGIPLLCEMGLDPGMDHMSAMKVIHEVKANNGEITSFSSLCGGLPAPEAANNPFSYKFTWSPRGLLTACQNSAVYLTQGRNIVVPGNELLRNASPVLSDKPTKLKLVAD